MGGASTMPEVVKSTVCSARSDKTKMDGHTIDLAIIVCKICYCGLGDSGRKHFPNLEGGIPRARDEDIIAQTHG